MKRLYIMFLIIFTTTAAADFTNMCGINTVYTATFEPYLPNEFDNSTVDADALFTCAVNTPRMFNATFERYLPNEFDNSTVDADTLFTCAVNTPRMFNAAFEPMVYSCSMGYYLPANSDNCTICPENSACIGGEYVFNENTTQGIISCENQFAPIGSPVCYPHIMHVGNNKLYLKSTKLTVPSLNVQIGNDVFYANITPSDVPMNSETDKKLKVNFNGNTYSVCDDTITGFSMPSIAEE